MKNLNKKLIKTVKIIHHPLLIIHKIWWFAEVEESGRSAKPLRKLSGFESHNHLK